MQFPENLQTGIAAGGDHVVVLAGPPGDDEGLCQAVGPDGGLDALVLRIVRVPGVAVVRVDPGDLEPKKRGVIPGPFRAGF